MDEDGDVSRIDDPKDPKPGEYKLTRTYWVHSSTRAFKRRTITLQDHVGELWPVIILQYSNTNAEEDVKVSHIKTPRKVFSHSMRLLPAPNNAFLTKPKPHRDLHPSMTNCMKKEAAL